MSAFTISPRDESAVFAQFKYVEVVGNPTPNGRIQFAWFIDLEKRDACELAIALDEVGFPSLAREIRDVLMEE